MYAWSQLSTHVEDGPVSKGPLLSVTAAMESRDKDGTLPLATVFVRPGQEIDTAGFRNCFTVRAALGLNVCLFYSMTLVCKLLPTGSGEQT